MSKQVRELLRDIENFRPHNTIEEAYLLLTRRLLKEKGEDAFSRAAKDAHITASSWIVNPEHTHVLLVHHKGLNMWCQPGGHCEEGDRNTHASAFREAREETGIKKLKPVSPEVFDLDVHTIPNNKAKGEKSHLHHDVRYFFETEMDHEIAAQEDEVNEVKWFALEDVQNLNSDESVGRMVEKTLKMRKV